MRVIERETGKQRETLEEREREGIQRGTEGNRGPHLEIRGDGGDTENKGGRGQEDTTWETEG